MFAGDRTSTSKPVTAKLTTTTSVCFHLPRYFAWLASAQLSTQGKDAAGNSFIVFSRADGRARRRSADFRSGPTKLTGREIEARRLIAPSRPAATSRKISGHRKPPRMRAEAIAIAVSLSIVSP
jgi:hypothetical protein